MFRFKSFRSAACAALCMMGLSTASATLIDRGGGMIYDDVLDITWLQDANYAKTSGYSEYGLMTWAAASAWAENLVHGGFDDWRLPTALNANGSGPCAGYNCAGSEMGELFYTEGGLSAGNPIQSSVILTNVFANMQDYIYWSSTEYAPVTGYQWAFRTFDGIQYGRAWESVNYAWAVRSGDVTAVPEPVGLLLLGLGFASLSVARRWGACSRRC